MRVLVLIQGALGDRLTGPEIRGWEIVRAFAGRHDVTAIAEVSAPTVRDGVPVLPRTRRSVWQAVRRHDVVIGPVLPPYALTAISRRRCLRVADLYDPVELELGTLGARSRAVAQQLAARRLHLRWSDVVLCANQAQLARTRHDVLDTSDPARPPEVMVVPMGLPEPPPRGEGHPLRELFPAIGADDPVVIWWGSVWRWLDASTPIRAVEQLVRTRPNLRLVITAGKPANAATDPLNATEQARNLAVELGLLDRNVFFVDEWVPFDDRHLWLRDADIGITMHAATAEATLAARARYMDYVWAGLPSLLAEGDEVAARLGELGAADLVPPQDVEATATALDRMLSEDGRLEAARSACVVAAQELRWERALEPLVARLEAMERPTGFPLATAREAGGYYTRRTMDRLLPSTGH
jgi:glycosyltransferase involved in cell wall biosynthesis